MITLFDLTLVVLVILSWFGLVNPFMVVAWLYQVCLVNCFWKDISFTENLKAKDGLSLSNSNTGGRVGLPITRML